MQMTIEPPEFLRKPSFNSNSPIPWKEVKEGNIIYHKGVVYEVAFKSIRKRAVDGILLETNKILYLRPSPYGENVIAEIDEEGHFSLMVCIHRMNLGTRETTPCTSMFHESWTEEYLDSLKAEIKRKSDKIRSLLR